MATGNMTVTTQATFLPEIWSNDMLIARKNKLVLAEHVDRRDRDVMSYGDTIHEPRVGNRTASTKAPNTPIVYVTNTETEMILVVTAHIYDGFLIEDIVKAQSKYDNREIYVKQASYAIAKATDTSLFTLATANAGGSVGSAANTTARLAKTYFTGANALLDLADAPDEERYLTVDGNGYKQLLDIDDFIRYDANGKPDGGGFQHGKVGALYNLEVLKTNNVPTSAANIKNGIVFHKEGIALAMQIKNKVEAEYSVDYIGWKVVVHQLFGHQVARTDHIVNLFYGIG